MLRRRLWREAASLILIAKNVPSAEDIANYQVLLTNTIDKKTKLLCNRYTFLRTAANMADFNPRWAKLFQRALSMDPTLTDLNSDFSPPIPPVLCKSTYIDNIPKELSEKHILNPRLGLRITAIRHAFLETGILFSRAIGPNKLLDKVDWMARVQERPMDFLHMCEELHCCPDVWSLFEWSNWLTPSSKAWVQERYDTMFFICILDHIPKLQPIENLEKFEWKSPTDALNSHREGEIWLDASHFYEMSCLENIQHWDALDTFSKQKANKGIDRWQSVYIVASDGVLNLLPGDDLYPEHPDLKGDSPAKIIEKTMKEIANESQNLNRIELAGMQNDRSVRNIISPYDIL